MKDKLLEYCYKHKKEYIMDSCSDIDEAYEQFECLIALVEDDTIKTFEQLKEYGMDYENKS